MEDTYGDYNNMESTPEVIQENDDYFEKNGQTILDCIYSEQIEKDCVRKLAMAVYQIDEMLLQDESYPKVCLTKLIIKLRAVKQNKTDYPVTFLLTVLSQI